MGFRFRKSIRLLPGIRLNISKTGLSTSVGRRGATINIGKRGVRGTVSLPGSGLSYSDMIVKRGQGQGRDTPQQIGDDAPHASGSGFRNLLLVVLFVIAALGAILFAAGLMSARQSSSIPSQGARAAPNASLSNLTPVALRESASVHVKTDANCRANPNGRAKVITTLSGDQELTLVDKRSGWARVTTSSQDCWVASRLVR